MSHPASPSAPSGSRSVIAVALLAGIVAAMQIGKVPAALPGLRDEFGMGLVTAGWFVSLITASGAAIGVATGILGDRLGRRNLLLGGLAALACGSIGASLASGTAGLLGWRLVEGVGFVSVVVAAPALIAAAAGGPAAQRLALAAWSTYMSVGVAGMLALTPTALDLVGWRGLWRAEGLLLLLTLLLAAWGTRRASGGGGSGTTWRDMGAALARPGPWLLAACFAAYSVQWFGLTSWLPTFLVEQLGLGLQAAAVSTAAVVIANAPGALLGGWLLHRGVPRWRLLAAAPAIMGLLALGIFSATVPAAAKLTMAVAYSLFGGMLPAAVLAGVPLHSRTPREMSAISGAVVQGSNLGGMAGPPFLALAVAWFGGWEQSGPALALAAAAGIALALAVRRVENKAAATSQ